MHPFLYLASQSPRRSELLKQLGVRFEQLQPSPEEDSEALELHLEHEPAIDYVRRVTLAKLDAAIMRLETQHKPWAPILCADTTVAIETTDGELILGKPENSEHAFEILEHLNGRTHQVHTAIALCSNLESEPLVAISSSVVEFGICSQARLKNYIATGEPFGKAGAYGIQGLGACLISKIEGSYSGIMGLPLYETALLLETANIAYALSL